MLSGLKEQNHTMETFINLLGLTGSIILLVVWLPQAISTWKSRRVPQWLAVQPLGPQYFTLLNAALWGLYAVLSHAYWVGIPGLAMFLLALLTVLLIHRGRKDAASGFPYVAPLECACGWRLGGPHSFFITDPSDYGTIRHCDGSSEAGFAVPDGTVHERTTGTLMIPDAAMTVPQPA